MATGEQEPRRHVVVFDCNVYLDVADSLGAPFSWTSFNAAVARVAKDPVPHPVDRANDALRAIAVCMSGRFAGPETIEVWTNAHIDKIVRGKATHPIVADEAGYSGLGWAEPEAQALIDEFIGNLIAQSNGGTLGDSFPDGNPPLDHEDGMVFGACRWLAGDDPLAEVYCVTSDKGFLKASKEGRLGSHTRVMTPSTFVRLIRAARTQYSVRQMKPG
ncbi:hypothetical protein [Amycolatopsis sp. lyj-112]|uniref:hypothetical protein n=1 Tax=Amycolatopsis sp. lyj-112 TaxID=2789288 RepID=UPI00397B4E65